VVSGNYLGNEFIRVGYYVMNGVYDNNQQMIPKDKLEQMNIKLSYDKIVRNILVNKPRVT